MNRGKWGKTLGALAAFCMFVSCSAAPAAKVASLDAPEVLELTVWLIPGTGLDELIAKYDERNPDVRITIQTAQYEDIHTNLQTAFAAGYGAPDVSLIELSYIEKFKKLPAYFYNLNDFGAREVESNFLDWKWQQAQDPSRTFVFGLPTDIGPLAVAYRRDLFMQAGLPFGRDDVSDLFRVWDDYLVVGKIISERTGVKMFNNLKIFYRMMFSQLETQYFDRTTGKLILSENPDIRKAWDYAMEASQLGLSANIETYLPEWGDGLAEGKFAVMPAPAWMTGMIRNNAPEATGKWDLARLHPDQHSNWGGSFLTLPKEGEHPEQAFRLIRYLTSPEQQLRMFADNGNFPSTPVAYTDASIRDKRDPYFNDAPVGDMFSQAAKNVKPVYEGPLSQVVATALDDVLQLVDNNQLPPEQGWAEALKRVDQALASYDK
ncbi:extracellular solute-binding protein [Paenibacillus sp. sgz302251]|uniref:ABC transporter substrate-binding protein n=1 Tax=Paenibacillus sp. sgz302251 TaxID=3414493 RepID=UPI003C7ADB40